MVVSIASVIKSHGCVDSTMFSLVLTTTTDVSTVALGSHSVMQLYPTAKYGEVKNIINKLVEKK